MTIKHSHHPTDVDRPGSDSWRHFHEGRAERSLIAAPDLRVLFERSPDEYDPVALARRYMADADIVLAVHHDGGEALDKPAVHAIALHEIGHLLGLDHTADVANIMTPRVRVRDLSAADRSTMQLLYSLPPGPVR